VIEVGAYGSCKADMGFPFYFYNSTTRRNRMWNFIKKMVTSWKVWVFTAITLSLAGAVGWWLRKDKYADGSF
jgi:hypothetical protein